MSEYEVAVPAPLNETTTPRTCLVTRLANGFSKKIENLEFAVALHFRHYNLCRIHQTLKITPAMAAGVSDHLWEISDIITLLGK